jgi:hypothetical protein
MPGLVVGYDGLLILRIRKISGREQAVEREAGLANGEK